MYKFFLITVTSLIILFFTGCASESASTTKANLSTKPSHKIENNLANPYVMLQTTKGDLKLELFKDIAPLAVENFMTHIKDGYYNGIAFHRVIKDFMIQCGDPTETGRGGKSIWNKPFKDEFKNKTFDKAGILAMANRGPNTNGSQFFITTAPTPWLNGRHTIFGQITQDSYPTLQKLNETPVNGSSPIQRVEIIKASIISQGKE